MKKERGITLIALVITIIVLLILAGVSITLTLGDNGILSKAQQATINHGDASTAEQIKLAYAAYETAKAGGSTETAANYVKNRLKDALGLTDDQINVSESNGLMVVKGPDGKTYKYNPITGEVLTSDFAEWSKIDDETYSNGKQTLKVGDYVNYDPTVGATEQQMTYTSTAAKSGYSSDQSFDARTYKNAGYKWRLFDIKNGQVRLIAEEYLGPGEYSDQNKTNYQIFGKTGYVNIINELNTISAIFGHGKGGESAASVTIEDINEMLGYNPSIVLDSQGNWDEYNNKVTYTRGEGNTLTANATNGKTWSGAISTFDYFDGTNFVPLTGSKTITCTSYEYNPTTLDRTRNAPTTGVKDDGLTYDDKNELIFGRYKADPNDNYWRSFIGSKSNQRYWLASIYAATDDDRVSYGVFSVGSGTVIDWDDITNSFSEPWTQGFGKGVRPIVTLKSDLELDWNSVTNQWDIK